MTWCQLQWNQQGTVSTQTVSVPPQHSRSTERPLELRESKLAREALLDAPKAGFMMDIFYLNLRDPKIPRVENLHSVLQPVEG